MVVPQSYMETIDISSEEYFEVLYQKYKRKVLNTAYNLIHHMSDAEEVTQDVFVELYFNRNQFRADSNISTWIYRVTVNKSLDLLKKRKRQKRFAWLSSLFDSESGKELHIIPDFHHPGVQAENQEAMSLLFKQIDKLPDNQKTALILSVMEQLSYAEISEVMNISFSAVESLIFRARKNLKTTLKNIL